MVFISKLRAAALVGVVGSLTGLLSCNLSAEPNWPEPGKLAVSLSYDDALQSQLDNAAPALKRSGISASFYPTLSSPVISSRLKEWRALAQAGHELGNHTLFHPCSRSAPGRSWVPEEQDLDAYSLERIRTEITTANAFLMALDGQTERTYTPPCLDQAVRQGNYVDHTRDLFVGVKSAEQLPAGWVKTVLPEGQTGEELIALVEQAAREHKLLNIIFHGIGGDYMTISTAAHEQLLRYLAANRDSYWVDSYRNIMRKVNASVAPQTGNPQSAE